MDNNWQDKGFYYEQNQKGVTRIKPRLLCEDARDWAKMFINVRPALRSTQLRRFYHDVKALEAKVLSDGFDKNLPLIKMLKSKVAYACPTGVSDPKRRKVPREFRDKFMDKCIDHIQTEDDFAAFALVFEAVVGYFVGEGGRE